MIREVDLVSYLPPFLAEYQETNLTLTAENPEFALVWKAADQVLTNEFIATADEYGISRFEKLLGIFPSKGEELESRRQKVQLKWAATLPYTLKHLQEVLASVLGAGGFEIDIPQLQEYKLYVSLINKTDEIHHKDTSLLLSWPPSIPKAAAEANRKAEYGLVQQYPNSLKYSLNQTEQRLISGRKQQ